MVIDDRLAPWPSSTRALVRHKGKVAVWLLVAFALIVGIAALSPRTYRAQAKLLVRLGRENAALDPTTTFGQSSVVAVPSSRENDINTIVEVLKSQVLLEKVVDALGPRTILVGQPGDGGPDHAEAGDPTERSRAIHKLAKSLDVEAVKRSNVIVLTYDGPSREMAQAVVSKLLEYYLEFHVQLNRPAGAHQFLSEQTARLRTELTHSEEQLRQLKNDIGIVSLEAQRQLLVNRIGRLQDELLQTKEAQLAAAAEVAVLRAKLAVLSPTQVTSRSKGMRNEAADQMRSQLYSLQLKELELSQSHPEGHPSLDRVRKQVAAAREILRGEEHEREQLTEGPNRVYEDTQLALLKLDPTLASLRTKAETQRAQLDQQHSELKALNANQLRIHQLERDIALQESHYRRYAESLEQAQIDRALEAERISNISLVQPAMGDPNPVGPRLSVVFGVGALVALLGCFGVATLAERWPGFPSTQGDLETHSLSPRLAAVANNKL
jgi:uncharacterized protein involved in exopolysaccharide biosynthesis